MLRKLCVYCIRDVYDVVDSDFLEGAYLLQVLRKINLKRLRTKCLQFPLVTGLSLRHICGALFAMVLRLTSPCCRINPVITLDIGSNLRGMQTTDQYGCKTLLLRADLVLWVPALSLRQSTAPTPFETSSNGSTPPHAEASLDSKEFNPKSQTIAKSLIQGRKMGSPAQDL